MERILSYHIIAFLAGYILDLILGDPYCLPHPIRLIGNWIAFWDRKFLGEKKTKKREEKADAEKADAEKADSEKADAEKADSEKADAEKVDSGKTDCENEKLLTDQQKLLRGGLLVILVVGATVLVSGGILFAAYKLHFIFGILIETIMTYQILATKCLKVESMKVYRALKEQGTEKARKAVSMIVGRDTACLDDVGIAKAAIETVAENTSDGVIAPMIFTAIGGPVLGFFYKAVNTMDSMVGYKNDRYLYFGRIAAKTDDVLNFLPARISAWLMILSCTFLGKEYSGKKAAEIYKRDRYKHASPNSAHTESVCAGALGIRLAGPASYFGVVHEKQYIGDDTRPVETEDIKRANRLLYGTSILGEIICLVVMVCVACVFYIGK